MFSSIFESKDFFITVPGDCRSSRLSSKGKDDVQKNEGLLIPAGVVMDVVVVVVVVVGQASGLQASVFEAGPCKYQEYPLNAGCCIDGIVS